MNERAEEGPRARLDPGRGDELADISEAFNQLMEREQAREAALVQRNLELSQQSRRDTLTGLFNRRHFEEWAAASWPALRGQAALIAIIDVDRFKRINDRFGHAVGDEVLVALARRLGAALRPEDLLLRWGGEEMVALALGPRAPGDLAARLLEVVDSDPVASSAGPLPVSVSIGLARLPLRAGELELPIERALVLADRALYAAKNAGRDCAIVIESLQVAGRAELADVEDNLWKAADFGLVTLRQIQGGAGSKALLAPAARVALGAE
ncbi:MAG: GGDEF domain-containing protein [Burkholderiales bacterium]|nr:GGDEF domain-containing protein [Burkholderiales bacterium]